MPRVYRSKDTGRTVYWWNPEIAELREQCNQARRRFARAQRRRWTRNEEEISRMCVAYRRTRKVLQREIKIAKDRSWKELIEEGRVRPHRAVRAVLPNWEEWRNQRGAPLTYRMTQILTGHGVFGEFLLRIGKESTSICHHCRLGEDSAQHTLTSCPVWEEPRRMLRMEVGEDLGPETLIIRAVLGGRQGHYAVRAFCEQVMLAKERAERERVRTGHPARIDRNERRTRRGGAQVGVINQE
jgi:hypothetical protein